MTIVANIPLLDEILDHRREDLGGDFPGYRNHVYRMVNFCFAQGALTASERRKIVIAGCFHDLGIWTGGTFDYLPPSIDLAKDYLRRNDLASWSAEIALMIEQHHKLRRDRTAQSPLIEIFRKGDLIDFSLGLVKCGLPPKLIKTVKAQFPNAGFHRCLLRVAGKWIGKHPFNPIPVLKW